MLQQTGVAPCPLPPLTHRLRRDFLAVGHAAQDLFDVSQIGDGLTRQAEPYLRAGSLEIAGEPDRPHIRH
jgi:hypothetical protein